MLNTSQSTRCCTDQLRSATWWYNNKPKTDPKSQHCQLTSTYFLLSVKLLLTKSEAVTTHLSCQWHHVKGAVCKNRPPVKFILKTNKQTGASWLFLCFKSSLSCFSCSAERCNSVSLWSSRTVLWTTTRHLKKHQMLHSAHLLGSQPDLRSRYLLPLLS